MSFTDERSQDAGIAVGIGLDRPMLLDPLVAGLRVAFPVGLVVNQVEDELSECC